MKKKKNIHVEEDFELNLHGPGPITILIFHKLTEILKMTNPIITGRVNLQIYPRNSNCKVIRIEIVFNKQLENFGKDFRDNDLVRFFKIIIGDFVIFNKDTRESFYRIDAMMEELKNKGNKLTELVLLAIVSDLPAEVSSEEAQEKALRFGMHYMEINLITGEHIELLYKFIYRLMNEKRESKVDLGVQRKVFF